MLITETPAQLTEKLWMLGTTPYPLYLFRGAAGGTIFEGGVGSMGPLLLEQLDQLGVARDFVKQVVVTHAHPDHVMAVPLLRQAFPEVTVLASETAAKTLSVEKAISFFTQMDEALNSSLAAAGLIADRHRPEPLTEKQIAVDRTIAEGDAIEVDDGVVFQVLQTPGHSDCSLSFFEPGDRVLLVSDATGYYMPQCDGWWPNYFGGYGAYMESMRRLAGLGAEVLGLSHNAAVKGADEVKAYFDRDIAATEAYHRRIVDETRAGKPVRQLAEQLGAEVYEKTQLLPLDFFQKNCGLLVKLSLKHEGMAPEK
jgi:glyoxylase-like metal-dependent hydrolase (beta-lactamase superfamily II)